MTHDELVKEVAQAISVTAEPIGRWRYHTVEAHAAIAVVLEAAAQEAEKWHQFHANDDGKVHHSVITETIAAAIRALNGRDSA